MAWNELDASGYYFVCFRLGKQRFKRSLKTQNKEEADDLTRDLERTLQDVERGRLVIPDDADVVTFLLSDGRVLERPSAPEKLTLKKLFDEYFAAIPAGSLERSTIDGMKIHCNHLQKHFRSSLTIGKLSLKELDGYVAKRSRTVRPATIKKEVVTLRTVWNWGVQRKMVEGPCPGKGLKYPKSAEKPPFMSFAEVEERTMGMSEEEAAELWESVYLTVEDIDALLRHVESKGPPFLHPMFCFAAHTGARRSEMLRCRVSDIDLKNGWVTLRERKKAHDQKTTRRVPISAALHAVLVDWLARHPGGDALFCHEPEVPRSKKRSPTTGHKSSHKPENRPTKLNDRLATVHLRETPAVGPLTSSESHNHFKKAVAGSKWEKLKGWHVLRHSFISAMAAKGIDQRIIDDFVGHCTEQQRRRYRHLLPNASKNAIAAVFG